MMRKNLAGNELGCMGGKYEDLRILKTKNRGAHHSPDRLLSRYIPSKEGKEEYDRKSASSWPKG